MNQGASQFGATLRLLRVDAGVSLRGLAQRIGVSSAYLSRVENGIDAVPTPERLDAIARELELSPGLLLELAHQVGPYLADYLDRMPAASSLFLDIAARDLSEADLARLREILDREFPSKRRDSEPSSLVSALSADRVILGLACSDLDDVIDLAAARLAPAADAKALADLVRAREAESPTLLGHGVAVPHARVPKSEPRAVLATLARPLRGQSPDGEPISLVVVLVGDERPREHLERLAKIALLASHNYVAQLRACKSPRQLLDRLTEIERASRARVHRAGARSGA